MAGTLAGRSFSLPLLMKRGNVSLLICQISKYHLTPKNTREFFKFKKRYVDTHLEHQNRAAKKGRLEKDVLRKLECFRVLMPTNMKEATDRGEDWGVGRWERRGSQKRRRLRLFQEPRRMRFPAIFFSELQWWMTTALRGPEQWVYWMSRWIINQVCGSVLINSLSASEETENYKVYRKDSSTSWPDNPED